VHRAGARIFDPVEADDPVGTALAIGAGVTRVSGKLIITKLIVPATVISATAAAILLWPAAAESPVAAMPAAPANAVRVEHELVVVPKAPPAVKQLVRPRMPRRGAPAVRLASVPKPLRPASSPGFVARAGRTLLGDGEYRPEPFPRPRD
jgi:hypothetical protein